VSELNQYIENIEVKSKREPDLSKEREENIYKGLAFKKDRLLESSEFKIDEIFEYLNLNEDRSEELDLSQKCEKLLKALKQKDLEKRRSEVLGTKDESKTSKVNHLDLASRKSDLESLLISYK
jgi:hypothetical protein